MWVCVTPGAGLWAAEDAASDSGAAVGATYCAQVCAGKVCAETLGCVFRRERVGRGGRGAPACCTNVPAREGMG